MDSTIPMINSYKQLVVLISGSHSVGTGFYIKPWNLILTNYHLARQDKIVKFQLNHQVRKAYATVVYLDKRLDLAFLKPAIPVGEIELGFQTIEKLAIGMPVIALGHPFQLKYAATKGILSNLENDHHGVRYLQHDAPLNPGNSGGPLIDEEGKLVGMNSFILDNADNISFALSVNYLIAAYERYSAVRANLVICCPSCSNLVSEKDLLAHGHCPSCGSEIEGPMYQEPIKSSGISGTLERVLNELGFDPVLAREGKGVWEIIQGSALIKLSYHQKSGLIIGEAKLAKLPQKKIKDLYLFMLNKNSESKGITMSVNQQDIILSTLILDRFFSEKTGKKILVNLFEEADKLDDVLVHNFGADWNGR